MQSPVSDPEDTDGVMRQTLSSYKPGSTRSLQGHGFRRVCLQLFGLVGQGKSSLINSCLCVVHNWPFSNEAGAGTSSESFTTARKEYKLTDAVYIIDNRGLNNMAVDERLELSAQFRNLRSISKVVWEFELERSVNQLEERCDSRSVDFFVPVLVHSIQHRLSKDVTKELSYIIKDAFEITGIFPVVVLTKTKTENPAEAKEVLGEMGSQHIFVLENYTTTNPARSAATDSQVLDFLNTCLQEADRGIQKRQISNSQWEFFKQAADQIKAEMTRQKKLQEEELGRKDAIITKKDDELKRKDNEIMRKESDISYKQTQISSLKVEINDLTRKLQRATLK